MTELLGIEHPILQAPMAGATTPALAAAVSNAGGLGSLGCAMLAPDGFREQVRQTRALTNRPVHVNFFCHEPPRRDAARAALARELVKPFYDELGLGEVPEVTASNHPFDESMLEAVIETRPQVVSFHFGLPADPAVRRLKDAGLLVMSSATTVAEARHLAARGVDAVIAQGWEAGGHRGTFLGGPESGSVGTATLVPHVADAVDVPVIAAGGIADGRGIAAAFALGASGVSIGTAFLTCPESAIPEVHKQALLQARDEDTRLTRAFSGRHARGLNNRYIEAMAGHEADLPDFPLMNTLTGPLRKAGGAAGSPDFVALWSGQAAPLNRALPAGELLEALVEDARARI
ncbi:MAG: nitronate monooxygenase [Acetobacterales bacterium]